VVDLCPDGGRETLIADVERDLGPVDVMVNNLRRRLQAVRGRSSNCRARE
jgi:hypothetical protein